MTTEALAKIPLLITSSLLNHITFTPPNPPPKQEEQAKYVPATGMIEKGPYTVLHAAAISKVRIMQCSVPSPRLTVLHRNSFIS